MKYIFSAKSSDAGMARANEQSTMSVTARTRVSKCLKERTVQLLHGLSGYTVIFRNVKFKIDTTYFNSIRNILSSKTCFLKYSCTLFHNYDSLMLFSTLTHRK